MSFLHHPSEYAGGDLYLRSWSGSAFLQVTTTASIRGFSDRVLGATGDNCPLSLVNINSYIGFTAARKQWVLKVIVDGTRTQFTLLEGYRCEGHLGSRSNHSCTLSSLSPVKRHGHNGAAGEIFQAWRPSPWSIAGGEGVGGAVKRRRPRGSSESLIRILRF